MTLADRAYRCAACGYRSPHEGIFRKEKGWMIGLRRRLCPACRFWRPSKAERSSLAAGALMLAIGVATQLAVAPLGGGSPGTVFLFMAGLLLSYPAATLIHEGGHALAAWAVGATVTEIVAGSGPSLIDRRLGSARLRLGITPLGGGHIHFFFHPNRYAAWKEAVILLAATLGNLAIAGLAILGWGALDLSLATHPFLLPLAAGFIARNLLVLPNLWPRTITHRGHRQLNDGGQFWRLLRKGRDATWDWAGPAIAGNAAFRDGRYPEAAAAYAAAWAASPGQGAVLASQMASIGKAEGPAAALACYQAQTDAVAALPDTDTIGAAFLDNNRAWFSLLSGDPALLPEADARSAGALAAMPDQPAFNGTRGAVLNALGRPAEAVPLLLRAAREAEEPESRAEACRSLAESYDALGKGPLAAELRRIAEWLERPAPKPVSS